MEDPPALPLPEPESEPDPDPEASPAPPQRLLRLRCAVQHYEWGQRGAASLVARLADQNPDPARPYAELWMGTHPSAPSTLLDDGTLLSDWLARNPDALGPAVAARWGVDLPFLFKVLRLVDERFRALDRCLLRVLFPVSNAG
jgi:mannose-6-phosphate isomerase